MKRILFALVTVTMIAGIAACGSDSDGSTSDTTGDGGSDTTVSTEDYVAAVDKACEEALSANSEAEVPTFADPTAPTPEELEAYVTYLDHTITTSEEFVEKLDDMPQPSDSADAETANELVDAFGSALESTREMRSAAQSGDVEALQTTSATFSDDVTRYTGFLKELGITGCDPA